MAFIGFFRACRAAGRRGGRGFNCGGFWGSAGVEGSISGPAGGTAPSSVGCGSRAAHSGRNRDLDAVGGARALREPQFLAARPGCYKTLQGHGAGRGIGRALGIRRGLARPSLKLPPDVQRLCSPARIALRPACAGHRWRLVKSTSSVLPQGPRAGPGGSQAVILPWGDGGAAKITKL